MRIIPHITLKGTFCNLQQGVIKVGKKRIKKQIYKPIKKRIKKNQTDKKINLPKLESESKSQKRVKK